MLTKFRALAAKAFRYFQTFCHSVLENHKEKVKYSMG